jgi:biopolymer transport protein ExbB
MSSEVFHELTFWALYLMGAAVVWVGVERTIYLRYLLSRTMLFLQKSSSEGTLSLNSFKQERTDDVVSTLVKLVEETASSPLSPERRQAALQAGYFEWRARTSQRVWIIDTIVTAAPLLGLLGTIFGIIDTFVALASEGNPDPQRVSAGIGTALYATGLGISVALIGVLVLNFCNSRLERLQELFKALLIRITFS